MTSQSLKHLQQKQAEAVMQVKKAMYAQKYREAKQLTEQQINEETNQSGSSDNEDEEGEDEEDEVNGEY